MGRPHIDAHVLMLERWFRLGLDIVQLTLPFHGARASASCRYSGERFASWHVGRLNEAVRQSVHDTLAVQRWLVAQSSAPVGVLGMSLGGYIAALLAALEPTLAFIVPVVPAVCLADLPTRLFAYSRTGRAGVLPPLTHLELERAYRPHSPLTYPLALPRQRVLVVGARGDGVTPFTQAHALWEHWQRPSAVWFSGGHVTPFQRSRVAGAVTRHLRALDVVAAPRSPAPDGSRPVLVALPGRHGGGARRPLNPGQASADRTRMRLITTPVTGTP
jgi:pimeloyl-ACP methyl ester carboxylesterase